jgi:hypothetical protein
MLPKNPVELRKTGVDALDALFKNQDSPFHMNEPRLHLGLQLVDAQIQPLQPLVQQNPKKNSAVWYW